MQEQSQFSIKVLAKILLSRWWRSSGMISVQHCFNTSERVLPYNWAHL